MCVLFEVEELSLSTFFVLYLPLTLSHHPVIYLSLSQFRGLAFMIPILSYG